eukprot:857622-Pyramimonas_sp.AAC.2
MPPSPAPAALAIGPRLARRAHAWRRPAWRKSRRGRWPAAPSACCGPRRCRRLMHDPASCGPRSRPP